jgi:hypothetical protein
MGEILVLSNSYIRNLTRRLRGWVVGDFRAFVLASDRLGHQFFCTFDIRASNVEEAAAKIAKSLNREDAELLEVDEWLEPVCPMPLAQDIVQVGGRVFFDSEGEKDDK